VVLIEDKDRKRLLTEPEKKIITVIHQLVKENNIDNISRTNAYLKFYQAYQDIRWSFLAHMVSRNAGWNMCDLEGKWFPKTIDSKTRSILYNTYERANWLIFQDAFPQLLLYHYSTENGEPMFHLLKFFHVSEFMVKEWEEFWHGRNQERLLIALIINEQNVIQKPVIEHPYFEKKVFHSMLFSFQDWFHYSCVLLPTIHGQLYGSSVNGFRSVDKRIDLGKRLASILFDERWYPSFIEFAQNTIHSGSRYDYEQYLHPKHPRTTPYLRLTFPVIRHHIHHYEDWSKSRRIKSKWFSRKVKHRHPVLLTTWFKNKQRKLHRGILLKHVFSYLKTKKRANV
jgi:hypothetical protein